MLKLKDLEDVNFVSTDAEEVKAAVFELYKEQTGRTLAKGDPVRLFLLTISNVVINLLNDINNTGKQNLLKYATGQNLDHIGTLLGVDRTPAAAATTTLKATLSSERTTNTTILAGTRVTAGDNVYFATDAALVIEAGQTEGTIAATCTETGEQGNGYAPGELSKIVDPQPYLQSLVNTTTSEGGADIEKDDSYREVIHAAPERFSTAGPEGAYKYWAQKASTLVHDVAITSPEAGKVNVYVLLAAGGLPGTELLKTVGDVLNADEVRPLTDAVSVLTPAKKEYAINLTYYVNKDDAERESYIIGQIEAAVADYIAWQCDKLGRDINPSKLIGMVMAAGAKRVVLTSPSYTVLTKNQVGICTGTTISYGKTEEE